MSRRDDESAGGGIGCLGAIAAMVVAAVAFALGADFFVGLALAIIALVIVVIVGVVSILRN